MKKIFLFLSMFIGLLFINSCGTDSIAPKTYNYVNIKEFDKSFDKCWRAISDLVANWGLTPSTIDKQSGLMVLSGVWGDNFREYCDCGTPGNGFGYYGKLDYPSWKITISVTSLSENKCKIKINTFYSTTVRIYEMNFNNNRYYETGSKYFNCNSTGKMENSIFNYIEVYNQ